MTDALIVTPRTAFETLLAGNRRFVAGASEHPAVQDGRVAVVGLSYRLADGTAHLVTARGLDLSASSVA